MIREMTQNPDQQQQQTGGTRFMQCRLPVALYEWLRLRAFVGRTSMNSIVLQAIQELQADVPDVEAPMALPVIQGTSGGVKFNVRLSELTYEWLRTKAFNSRGSINQLLVAALEAYRQRKENNG
jgi:predicted HicB family RNase H-like nuclease